ncbi:MAG TPA: hypothetical protein DCF33_14775 [Saprospirales bacterium]|nr:hypothetical protein [Saprospirales bacterium]
MLFSDKKTKTNYFSKKYRADRGVGGLDSELNLGAHVLEVKINGIYIFEWHDFFLDSVNYTYNH